MRTDDLIQTLAADARPVTPLRSPALRTLAWAIVAAGCIGAGVWIFGTRADLAEVSRGAGFLWISALAAITAGLSAHRSLLLSIPGAERAAILRLIPAGIVLAWTTTLAWAATVDGQSGAIDPHWPACVSRIAGIAAIPALMLIALIRRAAPLTRTWTGALALAGATAAGALAIQAICPLDDAAHALRGHLSPVLAATATGALAARRLFKP